jgi:long-chain acyl-CoA synthetase
MQDAGHRSVVEWIFARASAYPRDVALIDGSDRLTFEELATSITSIALELRRRGVDAGDRVVLDAASSQSYVASYFAVHLARAINVPIDSSTPGSRRDWIVARVAARQVLAVSDQAELTARARAGETEAWTELWPLPSDVADIMFTSGTTGEPKGVELTHGNLATAARHISAFIGTRRGDVEVLPLPLCHAFGLGSMRSALTSGVTIVLVDGFAFPGQIFVALESHRATGFRCVPAGLAMMTRLASDRLARLSGQIRYMEIGSAAMRLEDKQRLISMLPRTRICMHYGLTEAARSAFIEFHESSDRLHSIGRPAVGVGIRISGPDGQTVPCGTQGEIRIRGAHIMRGYWNDPQRTRSVVADDWFCTGDLGYMDADGYIYLVGRSGEMINVGGRKVSPSEVEDALRSHPAVHDVACAGIPDPAGLSEEAVGVIVVLKSDATTDERELREHLRQRLDSYMIPRRWQFSSAVPRTANGKVQRHLVRAQFDAPRASA